MGRISLQNDNNSGKAKRSSFFDTVAALEDEISNAEQTSEPKTSAPKKELKEQDKKFRKRVYIAIAAVAVILCAAIIISGLDFMMDGELIGVFKNDKPTKYKIYKPDWETTDIYTIEAYLELEPDLIMYSSDGVASVGYDHRSIEAGTELYCLAQYFWAIKQGDNEKLNSLFTESYLAKNGEFEDFPMQKVYKIEITKSRGNQTLDNLYGKMGYSVYAVKYNIYRNDGLFCAEVDETHAREEGILLITDKDGSLKIAERIDAKNFM